jgi:predicted Co/Zn/Cd cation transporter (cation efflux family)
MTGLGERALLRLSIAATLSIASLGIALGLLSGSFSIAFDGVYSLADAAMTGLALWISSLIASSVQEDASEGRLRSRFTMGFWHLEPIVLLLNGTLLVGVTIYALVNAIAIILSGGHELRFDFAILYAALTLSICAFMAVIERTANRRLGSRFITLDIKAWIMSGGISAALLAAFTLGYAVSESPLEWISPYVDPTVLAVVCLTIIPLPVGAVWQALRDILLIAPPDLQRLVDEVAKETVTRHGFVSYRAYVATVGRAVQVELHFVVQKNLPARALEDWDRIRDELGKLMPGNSQDRWLTIVFTTDLNWAD